MKIQAVSNKSSINKTRRNTKTKQDLTGFNVKEQNFSSQNQKSADAIKVNFLSNVSFRGHQEEFSEIPKPRYQYDGRDRYYICGTSGAVHTRLTDPKKDLTTHTVPACGSSQDEANKILIKNSSSFYPNSSIENTDRYRTGYVTNRVYFADPEEVVFDQTRRDFDYIVYDNRPVYPRLEDVKKNYFDYDYIPLEKYYYYWPSRDNAQDFGQHFKTIAEYYYRLEAADRKELEKLKKEIADFENEYQNSLQYKQELDAKKNECPWENPQIDSDKEKADYFYHINQNRYSDLSQKIGYYSDRVNYSKMQQRKAIQAFKIFDEVGLMFMERDKKRKEVSDAEETIDYDSKKIKEYDSDLKTYYSQKDEILEQIKVAKQWKAINDKKISSPAKNYDSEKDYYSRRDKEEYDKKDREFAEDESKKLSQKIKIWEDKLEKIALKISHLEHCKEVSQNSIKTAEEKIPRLKAEIKNKSDEIKSYYPKMEEFYRNNLEEWQFYQ